MAQFSYLFTSSIILHPSIHQTIYDPVISLLSPYPQPRSISSLQPENLIWTCSHCMVSAGLVSKFQREQPSQPLRHMGWNSTLTMSMNWMVMMLYLCLVWYVRPTPMASHSTIAGGYGKPEAFRCFAKDTFGIRVNNTPCILAVLQHPIFWPHVRFFTSTHYGQAVLSFGLMEAIISSKLDEVCLNSIYMVENIC